MRENRDLYVVIWGVLEGLYRVSCAWRIKLTRKCNMKCAIETTIKASDEFLAGAPDSWPSPT